MDVWPNICEFNCNQIHERKIIWPTWLGNLGLLILGVQMGSTFTPVVLNDIKGEWLQIVLMSVFILLIALLISIVFKKIANVHI